MRAIGLALLGISDTLYAYAERMPYLRLHKVISELIGESLREPRTMQSCGKIFHLLAWLVIEPSGGEGFSICYPHITRVRSMSVFPTTDVHMHILSMHDSLACSLDLLSSAQSRPSMMIIYPAMKEPEQGFTRAITIKDLLAVEHGSTRARIRARIGVLEALHILYFIMCT